MSFELLIWLLVIIFTVIAPLFRDRKQQGRGGAAPRQRQPGQPGQPAQAETRGADDLDPEDELHRRIEEARRRIFEATEAEEAARRQQAAPDRTGLPPPAAPVAPAGPARKPQRTQVDAAAAHTRAAAARTRRLREEKTGELQVTRLPRRETYTGRRRSITASSLLTRDSVLKGLVWHQILSEPPHRRAGRRQQSRPRSR